MILARDCFSSWLFPKLRASTEAESPVICDQMTISLLIYWQMVTFNDTNGTETSLMLGANAGHTLNIQPVHALVQHCCLHSPRSLQESAWVCLSREPALSCCRLHWLKAQQQTEKARTAGIRNQSINARSRRKMMILSRGRDSEYVVLKWSKGASPQGSIHHQMVSESWNFTDRVQMGALREKYF